jgi:hypothetical protein
MRSRANMVKRKDRTPGRCDLTRERPSDGVDALVADLRELARDATLELMIATGRLVVERLFGGDLGLLRSRGPKDTSLRRLAEHPGLPMSPASLSRAIGIYELTNRFPGLLKAKALGVAHLRAVLGLPPEVQERLLQAAVREAWSKAKLEEAAAARREGRRRRRPALAVLRSLRRLDRLTGENAALPLETELERLTDEEAARTLETVERLRAWCETLQETLARAKRRLKGP